MQQFFERINLIGDQHSFQENFGFTLGEYLKNRKIFSVICRERADHIDKFVKGSGIAKTVGGSVTIVAGGLAIFGGILVPSSVDASLVLTIVSLGSIIAGIAGGILGSAATIGASIAKDINIVLDQKKIKEALERFEHQDKVVGSLLQGVKDKMNKLSELIENGIFDIILSQILKMRKGGMGMIFKGIKLREAITIIVSIATRFANLVDDIAIIFAETAGRAAGAAGSAITKVLSGAFATVGIVFGAYDLYIGVKDIKGSEVAGKFRKFAKEYDEETECLRSQIDRMSKSSKSLVCL